ncbi:hypothetical protein KCP76_09250 [Salmonella enterica subsp. enterica serovar Weltevreden]|nr:hypothetical protein KCP76_09250 [Salmonella enterica subsp. enterica serovar Weltevreden]
MVLTKKRSPHDKRRRVKRGPSTPYCKEKRISRRRVYKTSQSTAIAQLCWQGGERGFTQHHCWPQTV